MNIRTKPKVTHCVAFLFFSPIFKPRTLFSNIKPLKIIENKYIICILTMGSIIMRKTRIDLNYITTAALIAAIYAALTYFGSFFGLSYVSIQVRFSEALTVLPIFTPAAIPGLTIGCFIANIGSFNLLDMVFGTLATLIAAILTYLLRNIKFKNLPLLALFPPVIINAVVIGIEIAVFLLPEGFTSYGLLISALQVGAGQIIACYGLGLPLYLTLKNRKLEFTFNRK